MIPRNTIKEISKWLKEFPCVAILGARQSGKTTLAKAIMKQRRNKCIYLDLEYPSHWQRLNADAELYLKAHSDKLIIIDEIQRMPQLYPLLRALIDDKRRNGRFLILGSSSPFLVKGVSESLTGRIAFVELPGITISEAADSGIFLIDHWVRGGFPVPLMAGNQEKRTKWFADFTKTYIEHEMRELFGTGFSSHIIRNYWQMLAANNGGLWNKEMYARSLGISIPTVNRYLYYMEGAFLVTRLMPWSSNLNKRLVKSPKLYLNDTGILHYLNRIANYDDLLGHPIAGLSWEGYVIEQIRYAKKPHIDLYYYRTHQGAEIDLLLVKGTRPVAAIEIKMSLAPSVAKGFYQSIDDLQTHKNYVIIPFGGPYQQRENVWCYSLLDFIKKVLPGL
jgi:predicted AAA+ superfamily ATPase